MIRFVVECHEMQYAPGIDRRDYVTVDVQLPELEALLKRGGRGEGGFESWRLLGAEILPANYEFRLKPRTITINGIEVPAPFEPKDNENFYVIDCDSKDGYRKISNMIHSSWTQFGAWRTEDEIKQVVAAFRNVFGRSDDAVNAARGGK